MSGMVQILYGVHGLVGTGVGNDEISCGKGHIKYKVMVAQTLVWIPKRE